MTGRKTGRPEKPGLDIFRKGPELTWSWGRPSTMRQQVWRETMIPESQAPALAPNSLSYPTLQGAAAEATFSSRVTQF